MEVEVLETGDRLWYQVALVQKGRSGWGQEPKSTMERRHEEWLGGPGGWMGRGATPKMDQVW